MTTTKGKKFRMGKFLVQYWYKGGKAHTKKLMIVAIGTKVLSKAIVYTVQHTVRHRTWSR